MPSNTSILLCCLNTSLIITMYVILPFNCFPLLGVGAPAIINGWILSYLFLRAFFRVLRQKIARIDQLVSFLWPSDTHPNSLNTLSVNRVLGGIAKYWYRQISRSCWSHVDRSVSTQLLNLLEMIFSRSRLSCNEGNCCCCIIVSILTCVFKNVTNHSHNIFVNQRC